MIFWNVLGVLVSLKGIVLYLKWLYLVINVVFGMFLVLMWIWWYLVVRFNVENMVVLVIEFK